MACIAGITLSAAATIQETDCHSFRYGKWLFLHNGENMEIAKLRRDLMMAVAPELYENILGSTDSELMFHLALTFGFERDPPAALTRMAGFIEEVGRAHGVANPLWVTVAATDGETIYSFRYSSDGDAPSLYFSRIAKRLGDKARTLVSEPIGAFVQIWAEVPQASFVTVRDGAVELSGFAPKAAQGRGDVRGREAGVDARARRAGRGARRDRVLYALAWKRAINNRISVTPWKATRAAM